MPPKPKKGAAPQVASRAADPAPPLPFPDQRSIVIRGAREHNLKNVDLTIPRDKLVVFTGLSGSGKSSLAFDTIYAEGQRRYVESLSAYARQFLEMMQKPDVDQIDGLSPAISIEQKTTSKNPRSTVGTVTEIYDYMRLLWARVGVPYSPATGLPIESQTVSQMVDRVLALPEKTRLYLLAPVVRGRKGEYRKEIAELHEEGLPAAEDRRRLLRDRRDAGAGQEVQARHRRGGGPDRGAPGRRRRGWPNPSRPRSIWPTASPSSNTPTRRTRRASPGASCSPPSSRARCRASRSRRSSRGCSRSTIRSARARPAGASASNRRSTPSWSFPIPRRHCARARSRRGRNRPRPITSRRWRPGQALQVPPRHAVAGTAEEDARRHPLRLGRRGDPLLLRRRPARLRREEAVRGRRHQPRAPLHRDGKRMGARGNLALHVGHALRGVRWPSPQARSARGEDRRPPHRRNLVHVGEARARMGRRRCPQSSTRSATRSPGAS